MKALCFKHQREPALPGEGCEVCSRLQLERKIVRKVAQALLAAGYSISVDNGECVEIRKSRKLSDIMAAAFATDEERFIAHGPAGNSFVFFVYGNSGYDVICDYGMSLEPVLAPVNAYVDQLELAA